MFSKGASVQCIVELWVNSETFQALTWASIQHTKWWSGCDGRKNRGVCPADKTGGQKFHIWTREKSLQLGTAGFQAPRQCLVGMEE